MSQMELYLLQTQLSQFTLSNVKIVKLVKFLSKQILIVLIDQFQSFSASYFVTRSGVVGAKWSTYVYMSSPSISKNQCEDLCLVAR